MTMGVPLGLLDGVDHICHGLDIVLLVLRDLLDSFGIPADIVSIGELGFIVDATVADIHGNVALYSEAE